MTLTPIIATSSSAGDENRCGTHVQYLAALNQPGRQHVIIDLHSSLAAGSTHIGMSVNDLRL